MRKYESAGGTDVHGDGSRAPLCRDRPSRPIGWLLQAWIGHAGPLPGKMREMGLTGIGGQTQENVGDEYLEG
jgi:hypothetical protein